MHQPRSSAWRRRFKRPALIFGVFALVLSIALAACGDDGSGSEDSGLSGSINGDGSSTVFPITEAVVEEFRRMNSDVDVTIGISGTGGGFEKFCAGETDYSNASRPISDEEAAACEDAEIDYVEFQVAYDGISVVVNPGNDFVDCLTVEQLNLIWMPESDVDNWSEVDESFDDQDLSLYGPGTDSGTFDYFTEQINGEAGASRSDYTTSEDDNVLVTGVAGDDDALGYFGYAYYIENEDQLKVLAVDDGAGCVEPTPETIADGSYSPLSRPLFVYVSTEALARPEVVEFMRFYLTEGGGLAEEVGYVAAPQEVYDEGLAQLP